MNWFATIHSISSTDDIVNPNITKIIQQNNKQISGTSQRLLTELKNRANTYIKRSGYSKTQNKESLKCEMREVCIPQKVSLTRWIIQCQSTEVFCLHFFCSAEVFLAFQLNGLCTHQMGNNYADNVDSFNWKHCNGIYWNDYAAICHLSISFAHKKQ